jgi:hypothetical protein
MHLEAVIWIGTRLNISKSDKWNVNSDLINMGLFKLPPYRRCFASPRHKEARIFGVLCDADWVMHGDVTHKAFSIHTTYITSLQPAPAKY